MQGLRAGDFRSQCQVVYETTSQVFCLGMISSGGNFVNFVDFDANDGDSHVTSNLGWVSTWDSLDGESWATLLVGVEDYLLADGGWAGVNPNLPVDGWPGDAPSVPIPEPSTAALVGLGLLAMARQRRGH